MENPVHNKKECIYWDICSILPYQRTFNFVNAPRSIGKTYSTQKWLLKQAIKKYRKTVYIVRTVYEKKEMPGIQAWDKVLLREFPAYYDNITSDSKGIYLEGRTLVHIIALSEAVKLKRLSFPNVYYIMFDEYQIEDKTARYINGFSEPELFINIYHTIDREENRVKCFLLGNNTSYYNPYHIYPLFGLPKDPSCFDGKEIWKNDLCLFNMASVSEELQREKENNKFLRGLEGTRYGDYANKGIYRDDFENNICSLGFNSRYLYTVKCGDKYFSLYNNFDKAVFTFSDSVQENCKAKIGLQKEDVKFGFRYLKTEHKFLRELLKRGYAMGTVTYTDMRVKAQVEPLLLSCL